MTEVKLKKGEPVEKALRRLKKKMDKEHPIPWRDLTLDNVYKIESTLKITSVRFGDAMMLRLCTIAGD